MDRLLALALVLAVTGLYLLAYDHIRLALGVDFTAIVCLIVPLIDDSLRKDL